MDWASAEWKQALSPLAAQKVSVLEEKIEKLQKDRQQKQLQFESLELVLEKEKRKVRNHVLFFHPSIFNLLYTNVIPFFYVLTMRKYLNKIA